MGIDAMLFADNAQTFYYDREYNLRPPWDGDSKFLNSLWLSLSATKKGLSKEELKDYIRKLIYVFSNTNAKRQIFWAKKVLKWADSLPDKCRIISRNDIEDEYFELCRNNPSLQGN